MGDTNNHASGRINLSHLTPTEIARRMLETPPMLEQQIKKGAAGHTRKVRSSVKGKAEENEAR